MLEDEGIEGLDVPSSEFVTADDLVSQSSLAAILQRIQGASTGGTPTGLHGNQIASVKALPSGLTLSTTTETTIKVTDEHAYALEISGDSMLPAYRDGDVIIVSPAAPVRRGDRVVVRTKNDEVIVKELTRQTGKSMELKSLNPDHPERVLPLDDVLWVARIVWASQ